LINKSKHKSSNIDGKPQPLDLSGQNSNQMQMQNQMQIQNKGLNNQADLQNLQLQMMQQQNDIRNVDPS